MKQNNIIIIIIIDELKIGNFKMGIGIAEKSHKTRRDRWGGNVNHKSLFVTGSTKTVLIAQDRKFDFFTQTQSLMNVLSSFTASVDQSKVVCFCWLLF